MEPQGGSKWGSIMTLLRCSQGPSSCGGGGVSHRLEPRREGGGCYARQAQSGALGLGWVDASGFRSYSKFETAGFTRRQKVGVSAANRERMRGIQVLGTPTHFGKV